MRPLCHWTLPGIFVLLCLTVAGCASSITGDTLLKMLQEKPAPLVVDVRSQGEYETGHIPGAINIPFYEIGSGLQQRGFSKNDMVVLYCEHGPRAGVAGFSLYLHGYERFFTVAGHMQAWRAGGMPVERSAK